MADSNSHFDATGMTVAQIRARLDASKIVAMDRFERDWGTRDVRKVADALRRTIPGSASPDAAIRGAQRLVAEGRS